MENNKNQIKVQSQEQLIASEKSLSLQQIASGIWKLRFGMPSAYTPTAHRKSEIKVDELSQLAKTQGEELQLPFGIDSVQIKRTNRGIVVTLPMSTTEDIFGFGLQLQSVNAAGRKRYIKVNSDPKMDTGESHAPASFLCIHCRIRFVCGHLSLCNLLYGHKCRKGRISR